ncbi:hypothetical protein C2S51_035021 [Perilla frutescens var. frutescens]|nr:hypothetical protein C2S51_035021 [Perilla frutescens var. frutescens]
MAESAVSFLLEQLSVLLRDERKLLGGLKHEVQSINDELVYLRKFLRVADEKEESDSNLKEWVRQLREISFDVQDVLDEYMLRFGGRRATNGFRGSLKKVCDSVKNLKSRHQIAYEIKTLNRELETVVKNQKKYSNMYAIMDQCSSSTNPEAKEFDGRGDALFLEDDEVVGIEEPKEKLLGWIQSMGSGVDVISVVGTGGLGKTTLVKKVYDDESVKTYFDRHVWVTVSDYKDDIKHLLVNLIKKLVEEIKESPPQGLQDMSIDEMRNFIYKFLKENKYIIVLDDVWKLTTWEALKFALPRKGAHGCIIITTRSISIGDAACSETNHVYNLMPLSKEESEILFFEKAFPRNSSCPPYLTEFAENILKRCEGLPLAIVVIGGLLARKKNKREEWELFSRSLTHELHGGNLERLWKSLFSLSYNDLPYYLKYCFLYLSISPEAGMLDKKQILRLWIAEGFVQSEQDKILEEVAEEYLNELCSRSLIQVAEKYTDGETRAFRIHDLLRDYITSKSREHNIVFIYKGVENQWPNKIRRLTIHNSVNFSMETKNFEHLRSLLLSNGGLEIGMIKEILSRCRLLKVLDLRGSLRENIPDEVFKLYHLKYLCLRDTMVKHIPRSIKYLQNVETLDLKNTNVTELPVEILELHRLRHLLVHRYGDTVYKSRSKLAFDIVQSFKAPHGIGSCLQSLQTLSCLDGSIEIVRDIGMLTKLRDLRIAKLRSEDGNDLCSSIAKLTNLRALQISSIEEGEKLDLDYSLSSASLPFLRTLLLYGCLEKVPQWIPSLHALSTLWLWWCKLKEDPLNCLQNLPNLTYLRIHDACVEGLSFKAHGFQKLKVLELCEFTMLKWVIVETGSVPFLQNWKMLDCKLLKELPQGIENLKNLEYLVFYDMHHELMKRVVEEKKSHGDNWRLAHVSRVRLGTITNGSWSFVTL